MLVQSKAGSNQANFKQLPVKVLQFSETLKVLKSAPSLQPCWIFSFFFFSCVIDMLSFKTLDKLNFYHERILHQVLQMVIAHKHF